MSTSTETECTFDGSCRLSRKADITLEFDDGSTLMAHSLILCMASPVFETALKECTETKKLRLRSVDRDVWTSILKELYPTKSDVQANMWSMANCDAMLRVGKECQKYGIQSVLGSIEDLIVREVGEMRQPIEMPWDSRVKLYGKLAISLNLRRAMEALGNYTAFAMTIFEKQKLSRFKNVSNTKMTYPLSMIEVLSWLLEVDDLEWTRNFSLSIIHCLIETNTTT